MAKTVEDYLPSSDVLSQYVLPGAREIQIRDEFRKRLLGCDYALVSFQGKLVIVPAWHPLASVPQANAGTHYSHAIFEGGSARPVVKNGEVVGTNIILYPPKIKRLEKSLKAQGLTTPVPLPEISQGICDLIAFAGNKSFMSEDGKPIRSYIRPAMMRGEGGFGVTPMEDQVVLFSCIHWGWKFYLPEIVYQEGGLAAAFLDEQRLVKIRGKMAGNYSVSGEIGRRARDIHAHEAVLFGPYTYDSETHTKEWVNYEQGPEAIAKLAHNGTLVDGPGEDILFFKLDEAGKIVEMLVQPIDTNILAGTTRAFIIKSLAPSLGIKVTEQPVSVDDIRQKRVNAMCFCGNAVNVAPMKQLTIYDADNKIVEEFHFQVSPDIQHFVQEYNAQANGEKAASSPELLTYIEFDAKARQKLDSVYAKWL